MSKHSEQADETSSDSSLRLLSCCWVTRNNSECKYNTARSTHIYASAVSKPAIYDILHMEGQSQLLRALKEKNKPNIVRGEQVN